MGNPFKAPKTPPPPAPEEPAEMPVADDQEVKLAQRRKVAKRAQQSGRVSTILTQDSPSPGTLGG